MAQGSKTAAVNTSMNLLTCTTSFIVSLLIVVSGCGPHYVVSSTKTGRPLSVTTSAYTEGGCLDKLHLEVDRLRLKMRAVNVHGWLFGNTLLWPFYKGYSCTASLTSIALDAEEDPNS